MLIFIENMPLVLNMACEPMKKAPMHGGLWDSV